MLKDLKSQAFGNFYQIRYCFPFLIVAVFCYFFVDKPVAIFFNDLQHQGNALSSFFSVSGQFIQILFNGKYLFPVMLVFLLALSPKHQNQNIFKILLLIFLSLIFLNIILAFFKHALGRARPILFIEHGIYGFKFFQNSDDYFSCPSGHALNITIICLTLSVFYPQRKLGICVLGFGFLLGRIWYVKHYCSDVIFTIYLTMMLLPLAILSFKKLAQFKKFKFIQPSLDLLIKQCNRKSST